MDNIEKLKFSIMENIGELYNKNENHTSMQEFYDMTLQLCVFCLLQSSLHEATLKNFTLEKIKEDWERYSYGLYQMGLTILNNSCTQKELN